ncbi:MAG: proline--tRNA ligase [bacterium]
MRLTQTLIPTLREAPQDAEIPSHKLMMRAGLIMKLGGGLYTFLPAGLKALRKVEKIVREEMDRAGALEVLMPALQPREIWEQSGRYTVLKDAMFKIKDRQQRDMVLGPTHEEVITDLVSRQINSYRQLPKTFYQIQTKFRDEIRPRFGLMRAKEFSMKDAYSFDVSWEAADVSYQAMYDAYVRIFKRCGLRTKVVEADTGAMGGNFSHEFMVLADSGEDGIVECESCSYAANLERAERMTPKTETTTTDKAPEIVATPGKRTIDEVSAFLKLAPHDLIKTLIYVADGKPVAVLVPGDRDVNEHKLARALGGIPVQLADDATIVQVTGAPVGFAGPVGLKIPIYADSGLKTPRVSATGANAADAHLVNVLSGRDFQVAEYFDLVIAREGDSCPRCGTRMREKRGIEVGHVFKLGTKYSKAFDAGFLDAAGNRQIIVMGCYGIGVTRTLQAVIEQSYDENGIIWPISIAPYQVSVVVPNTGHAESVKVAEEIIQKLEAQGIDVLFDDRDERPGVKFKDADLMGLPIRAVISERSLAEGKVEVKRRTEKEKNMIPVSDAVTFIENIIRGELS